MLPETCHLTSQFCANIQFNSPPDTPCVKGKLGWAYWNQSVQPNLRERAHLIDKFTTRMALANKQTNRRNVGECQASMKFIQCAIQSNILHGHWESAKRGAKRNKYAPRGVASHNGRKFRFWLHSRRTVDWRRHRASERARDKLRLENQAHAFWSALSLPSG